MRRRSTEALVARKPSPDAFAELPRAPIHVVLDDVRGLANVGLIVRLCDNLRLGHLHLCGITGHPGYPGDPRPPAIARRCTREIERTAVMALPYVPWSFGDAVEVVQARKTAGDQIVVLEQVEESIPLAAAPITLPLCLVLGHERNGVRDELLALADVAVELPVYGMANSINVAMSLAMIGSELARRTHGFGLSPL